MAPAPDEGEVNANIHQEVRSEHLNGGSGFAHLNEEPGYEHLNGISRFEHLNGGSISKHLNEKPGSEHLNGGSALKNLMNDSGYEVLNEEVEYDHLNGGSGSEHLNEEPASEHLNGGSPLENLMNDSGYEVLNGEEEYDHLNGGSGFEHLNGGSPLENLKDDSGYEILNGEVEYDHLNVGSGSEYLNVGSGSEYLNVGSESEHLNEEPRAEQLNGGSPLENLMNDSGYEVLNGEVEYDHLHGGSESEQLNGRSGSEHLNGELRSEHLKGGSGLEHLNEEPGLQQLHGGSRYEVLKGGSESEHLNAGEFRGYPTNRDILLKSAQSWLAGKRVDDNVGNYWRVHDKLYDLTTFVDKHPGGREWIELHQGTDVTEAFESSHIGLTAGQILKKYYIKDADTPRNSPYTFHENGFYKTLKKKARPVLKRVGTGPTRKMLLMQDLTLLSFICICLTAARYDSFILVILAGMNLCSTVTMAHNFTHQRDNFRMYYFDLCLMASSDWRVTHVISHHLFTNSIYDWEVAGFEPFFSFLPDPKKNIYVTYVAALLSHIIYPFGFIESGLKRIVMLCMGHIKLRPENLLPLIEIMLMCSLSSSIATGLKLWCIMQSVASFFFLYGPQTGIHHHPDVWHHGDAMRTDPDWGLCQLDAVKDKIELTEYLFIVSTTFGDHTLHHLFPTVDHSKLHLLYPAFFETCKEFGITFEFHNHMFWGFYKQILNRSPKTVAPLDYKNKKLD